jgi:pantetheine-phosphate adenylyltransferase
VATALYAGSFDPIHLGHLALMEVAAAHFDRLFVVAAGNPRKQGVLFAIDERRNLIAASTAHLANVAAIAHTGLVVDAAAAIGADVLLRSIGKEHRAEFEMAAMNFDMTGIRTVFLAPPAATAYIASRYVRERFALDGSTLCAISSPSRSRARSRGHALR